MATTRSGTKTPSEARRAKSVTFRMPPFRHALPMLLLLARESVSQRFRPQIHARGFTDQQWRVIRALAEVDSLEIVELGEQCCIHAASLSRILPKLAADGIVSRCANSADQRRVIVSLTPAGHRLLEETLPDASRIYAQLARDIGPERLDHVYAVLEELLDVLGEPRLNGRARKARPAKPARAQRGAALDGKGSAGRPR